MSKELEANIVYGFTLDAHMSAEDLPGAFASMLVVTENPYYNSPDRSFNLNGAIGCTAQKRHGLIDTDFPGAGEDDEIVVFLRATRATAGNYASPAKTATPSKTDKEAITALADMFGKKPEWVLYATYI